MTLPLQEQRVNGDTHKGEHQRRREAVSHMRDLDGRRQGSSQLFLSGALDRSSELVQIALYAGKG